MALKKTDYKSEDMAVAATFLSHDTGLKLYLIAATGRQNPDNGVWEKTDPGLSVKFLGSALVVSNSNVLKLIMSSPDYKNGNIFINDADPTGLWRSIGAVKVRKVEVVEFQDSQQPRFEDIELDKLQKADVNALQKVV